jgi:hypothetical protein
MKLKYFQSHGWNQDWIETVREMVTEEFAKYDKASAPQDQSAASMANDLMDFGDIPMDNIAEVSELDTYLAQPVEKVRDVIAWWWDHRAVFPKLSSMALDYLSAPGMCSQYPSVTDSLTYSLLSDVNCCGEGFLTRPTATSFHLQPAFASIYSHLLMSRRLEQKGPFVNIRYC